MAVRGRGVGGRGASGGGAENGEHGAAAGTLEQRIMINFGRKRNSWFLN